MISIQDQTESGILLCPKTQSRLRVDRGVPVSRVGTRCQIMGRGVPVLFTDTVQAGRYVQGAPAARSEYSRTRASAPLVCSLRAVTKPGLSFLLPLDLLLGRIKAAPIMASTPYVLAERP
jgi:hypothetical protein